MKLLLASALFLFLATSALFSQVTIGMDESPVDGALLQLKEQATNNTNSTRGLGMPRVYLPDQANLFPMFYVDPTATNPVIDDLYNSTAKKNEQDGLHVGLLVYNTNQCLDHTGRSIGMHVWDGEKWEPLIKWGNNTVQGISGRVYRTATFGNMEWMVENLEETQYDTESPATGTQVPLHRFQSGDPQNFRGYYFPVDNTNTNYEQHNGDVTHDRRFYDDYREYGLGLMYSWAAATNDTYLNTVDALTIAPDGPATYSTIQGICPNGWRIPSERDWLDLEKAIAANPRAYSNTAETSIAWDPNIYEKRQSLGEFYRGNVGKNMKSPCLPAGYVETTPSGGLSNTQGFNVLLLGFLRPTGPTGSVYGISVYAGVNGSFWSSSRYNNSDSPNTAWIRTFGNGNPGIIRLGAELNDQTAVRCVKARN